MNGVHVCMSGSLDCSGVAPCDACAQVVSTYILVPAMKAAGIDQRNDPRVMLFLQTYAEAKRRTLAGILERAQTAAPPPSPIPSTPPLADIPLTAAELESMAKPVTVPTETVAPAMAGGPEPEESPTPTPAGLMSDDEFKARFPTVPAQDVMVGVPEEPSLLTLAANAITPKLPADQPASETKEVGSAPSPEAPSPAAESKAPTDDVSAVAEGANPSAEPSTNEATAHG